MSDGYTEICNIQIFNYYLYSVCRNVLGSNHHVYSFNFHIFFNTDTYYIMKSNYFEKNIIFVLFNCNLLYYNIIFIISILHKNIIPTFTFLHDIHKINITFNTHQLQLIIPTINYFYAYYKVFRV